MYVSMMDEWFLFLWNQDSKAGDELAISDFPGRKLQPIGYTGHVSSYKDKARSLRYIVLSVREYGPSTHAGMYVIAWSNIKGTGPG